jgi:hypothetical protein
MSDTYPIEIDIEVYKRIEMDRQSFNEKPNDILRRHYGIVQAPKALEPKPPEVGGRPWSGKGVILPHGTQLRMEYNSRSHFGEIIDGQWHVEGKVYATPSGAAKDVGQTKSGKPLPSLDGWLYWSAKKPGSSGWMDLKSLRDKTTLPGK